MVATRIPSHSRLRPQSKNAPLQVSLMHLSVAYFDSSIPILEQSKEIRLITREQKV